ncbi:hypothetical protein SAMN05421642_110185 [Rhodococcoides kyotonense]|uniref:Uncharacterized protein n=2 Tax=Rhodococcoides kyotonense TaxID=398843 RepID=A0A239KI50_9NOCA|nr:hypothetical protein SAMN05421642_110185 [Rhodococcus kyotonensis]
MSSRYPAGSQCNSLQKKVESTVADIAYLAVTLVGFSSCALVVRLLGASR